MHEYCSCCNRNPGFSVCCLLPEPSGWFGWRKWGMWHAYPSAHMHYFIKSDNNSGWKRPLKVFVQSRTNFNVASNPRAGLCCSGWYPAKDLWGQRSHRHPGKSAPVPHHYFTTYLINLFIFPREQSDNNAYLSLGAGDTLTKCTKDTRAVFSARKIAPAWHLATILYLLWDGHSTIPGLFVFSSCTAGPGLEKRWQKQNIALTRTAEAARPSC